MYAYAHIDSLYQKGDASLINRTNRYDVFEEVGDIELTLGLTDFHPGSYSIKRHTINRRNRIIFFLWVRMGELMALMMGYLQLDRIQGLLNKVPRSTAVEAWRAL